MNGFTKAMDKMKPKFEKIAANPYVSAVRDGFIAAMPIILFSSRQDHVRAESARRRF